MAVRSRDCGLCRRQSVRGGLRPSPPPPRAGPLRADRAARLRGKPRGCPAPEGASSQTAAACARRRRCTRTGWPGCRRSQRRATRAAARAARSAASRAPGTRPCVPGCGPRCPMLCRLLCGWRNSLREGHCQSCQTVCSKVCRLRSVQAWYDRRAAAPSQALVRRTLLLADVCSFPVP